MAHQQTTPDKPSHTPGTRKGEAQQRKSAEPGREHSAATARNSTSINPEKRNPIDPRMPYLPPA